MVSLHRGRDGVHRVNRMAALGYMVDSKIS